MNASEILERVRAGGLLAPGRPVLVLLSGGRDSVCLLDIAVRIAGPDAVRALHVNYGLREQAAEDEHHCVRLCRHLGVPLEIERPSGPPPRGNIQAWAREVRYGAAALIAQATGAEVASGHTASDQVEGVLYRLASAPSRRALLGMRERNGIVVRPLLGVTRAQTGAYCHERGLSWRDDATNDERVYARGRIRGELVPALRAIHTSAEANVLALVEVLRDEAEVLDALRDDQRPKLVLWADSDPILSLETGHRFAAALRTEVHQVIEDAGHFLQEDAGPEIGAKIAAWLESGET